MNKKKLMGKIIAAVIAGGLLISTGTAAFAASTSNSSPNTNGTKQEARMTKKHPADMMKLELDKLVTAGTITKDEETKILNYLTEKQTERKAEMDKVKDMSEADRNAYFESKKTTKKTDMFSELVTAGIITQDKADAIKAAMPAPKSPVPPQAAPNN